MYDEFEIAGDESDSVLEEVEETVQTPNEFDLSILFGFPININLVLLHLKQDMRDDWYFDVLQYRDLFEDIDYCKSVIVKSFKEGHGVYLSDIPTVRGIPKKELSERYALETDFFDRFVYQAAVTYLIPYIDPLLSHKVLSYRYEKYPLKRKYLFKNKLERWNTFEGITLTFMQSGQYLAVTDLTNFFEGISSELICDKLLSFVPLLEISGVEKRSTRAAIDCLRQNLKKWSFRSGIGLPQNRDASSFLSNVMLYDVDDAMVKLGFKYYRYVDDIRIICESEAQARKSLTALTKELRKYGLSLNGGKTKILGPNTPRDQVTEVFTGLDTRITAINNMWKSRSRRVVARSTKYICDIVASCIDNQDTQSRSFRFAVNRLSQLIQAGLIDVNDSIVTGLRSALIDSLFEHAVSTDQYCRILNAIDPSGTTCVNIEEYLLDRNKSIYDWQNYNIWLLLAKRQYATEPLKGEAIRVLREAPESGETAAIFIWGMAVKYTELASVALGLYLQMHKTNSDTLWPYLNQRNFLISANSLDKTDIDLLRGVPHYKLARTVIRSAEFIDAAGIPIVEPEDVPLSLLIEEVSDYD